jgi:hypothetical protein
LRRFCSGHNVTNSSQFLLQNQGPSEPNQTRICLGGRINTRWPSWPTRFSSANVDAEKGKQSPKLNGAGFFRRQEERQPSKRELDALRPISEAQSEEKIEKTFSATSYR